MTPFLFVSLKAIYIWLLSLIPCSNSNLQSPIFYPLFLSLPVWQCKICLHGHLLTSPQIFEDSSDITLKSSFFKLNISNCFIYFSYYLVPTPYIKYSAVKAQSFKKFKSIKYNILYDHTDYCETIISGVITRLLPYLSKINSITT